MEELDIQEIVKSGANVQLYVLNISDLKELFLQWYTAQNKPEEVYLSPQEAAEELHVDKSTLWRWKKQGYLVPIKLGCKPRYRLSDIKKLMEE